MAERERVWEGLGTGQGDGRACVSCGRDYLHSRRAPARRVPVGRSLSTGSQVFACAGECLTRAEVRCYPGGAMALSGVVISEASRALHHAVIVGGLTLVGDPRQVQDLICATVAAAPLVIAAELRWLAWVFDEHARSVWSQITNTVAALEGTDPAGQRHEALLECSYLARRHAFGMDPAGGAS